MTNWMLWIVIGLCSFLMFFTWLLRKKNPFSKLRQLDAYTQLQEQNLAAFEKGKRLIFGLGGQSMLNEVTINDISGLPVFSRLSRQIVNGDQVPQAYCSDGVLACLSQSILDGVYKNALIPELFSIESTLLVGANKMSFVAGLLNEINTDSNDGLIMFGSLKPEALLAVDLAHRHNLYCQAISDSPSAQAIFYAAGCQPVIGEEYFAAGASLKAKPIYGISLRVQDLIRILIIIALLVGAIVKLMGLY